MTRSLACSLFVFRHWSRDEHEALFEVPIEHFPSSRRTLKSAAIFTNTTRRACGWHIFGRHRSWGSRSVKLIKFRNCAVSR